LHHQHPFSNNHAAENGGAINPAQGEYHELEIVDNTGLGADTTTPAVGHHRQHRQRQPGRALTFGGIMPSGTGGGIHSGGLTVTSTISGNVAVVDGGGSQPLRRGHHEHHITDNTAPVGAVRRRACQRHER
jgi:hypothetical protein